MWRVVHAICLLLLATAVGCGEQEGPKPTAPQYVAPPPGPPKSKDQLRAEAGKLAALTEEDLETLLRHCDKQAVYAAVAMSNKGDLLSCTIMSSSMSDNDLYNAKQAGAAPSDEAERMSWFVMSQQSVRDRLKQGIPMDEYLSAQYSFLCGQRDWKGDPGGRAYRKWTCEVHADDLGAAGVGVGKP